MDAKIDYLSFTCPAALYGAGHSPEALGLLVDTLDAAGHQALCGFLAAHECTPRPGRAHYGAGLYFGEIHASVWFGGIANHILVELAGVACQASRDAGLFDAILSACHTRLTRLDVAVDSADFGSPKDFVSAGYNERFKSRASIESSTGQTEYVGGLKSERFARIYCYAPPHPRSGVSRVETVLRGDYAKNAGEMLLGLGLQALVGAVGVSFGWQHPAWKPEALTAGKLRSRRYDTHGAGTLLWLENAVRPALERCKREGLIDLEEWFKTFLQ